LGAGCGAVTRWLGEHFQDVHAIEGSFQRAYINGLRCRGISGVKVYTANFFDVDIEKQFDILTLIGVLEYSHLYHPIHKKHPYEAAFSALQFAHRALKEHGILLLAIENKLGLKYFSGAKEDHTGKLFDGIQGYPDANSPVTFSAAELDQLLRSAGFTAIDFYLPFPDYKLARTVLNAQALSTHHHYLYNWIETPFPDRCTKQRMLLFNESLALREISKAGLLREFSNSFLIIAHKGKKDSNYMNLGFSEGEWLAKHYSLNRHWTLCKKATLLQTDTGSLRVDSKSAFDTIEKESRSNFFFTNTFSSEKFCPGDLLLFSIFEMLVSETFDSMFQPLLEKFQNFLIENFSIDKRDEMGMPLLSGKALDVTFWNIVIEEKTGEWIIIDREWTFHGAIPVDFIICRNINHLFIRYKAYFDKANQYIGKSANEMTLEIMQKMYPSYNQDRFISAMKLDNSFQNFSNKGASYQETSDIPAKLCQLSVSIGDLTPETINTSKPFTKESTSEAPSPLPSPSRGEGSIVSPPLRGGDEGEGELYGFTNDRISVSIVIPVFNRIEYTQKCLEALNQNTPGELCEIIIVDNASTDGTEDFLSLLTQQHKNVFVFRNHENLGFAKACNQGAKSARGKYLVFLNNDTVPQTGWLEEMVRLVESDDDIGIVGSKLLFPDGTIQHAGVVVPAGRLPYHIYRKCPGDLPATNKQRDYQIVTAACMLIRKDLFFDVGGFDERYINGCEDIDLCLKVREKKKRVVYNPKSVVIHFEGKTTGRQDNMAFNRLLFLQIWKDKITQDDRDFLKQDGMEIIVTHDGSFRFITAREKTSKPKISLIIVTCNSEPTIKTCLNSVFQYTTNAEVLVIDNASSDNTCAILSEYRDGLFTMFNNKNKWFSCACNQGIRASRGEYIILLNPDTIVTPMWADRMIAHFRPSVGAVGPVSNYVAAMQKVELYSREPLVKDLQIGELAEKIYQWNAGRSRETKLLIGFCVAIPRAVLDAVGPLDEDLLLGSEDFEISWRLRQRGYKLIIATDTFVYHEGQVSFKSQKKELTSPIMKISSERLCEKLEAYYGAGNVPTAWELWGVGSSFFKLKGIPILPKKPTFAACYCLYDDITWLSDSIKSIYNTVEAIYFLINYKLWYKEASGNCDTIECIRRFPDPDCKIRWGFDSWENEDDQRNTAFHVLKEAGFTYCVIIDANGIYYPEELQRMIDPVTGNPDVDC